MLVRRIDPVLVDTHLARSHGRLVAQYRWVPAYRLLLGSVSVEKIHGGVEGTS
jgi:hypothetical protein